MKKIFMSVMLIVILALGANVSYAKEVEHEGHGHKHTHAIQKNQPPAPPVAVTPAPPVSLAQPVSSIGNYNDFGKGIRLDWQPVAGAVSYNIYVASGYAKTTGFILDHKITNYAVRFFNRRYVIVDGVSVNSFGWYTVKIVGVDKNGIEGAPGYCSVNVTR